MNYLREVMCSQMFDVAGAVLHFRVNTNNRNNKSDKLVNNLFLVCCVDHIEALYRQNDNRESSEITCIWRTNIKLSISSFEKNVKIVAGFYEMLQLQSTHLCIT